MGNKIIVGSMGIIIAVLVASHFNTRKQAAQVGVECLRLEQENEVLLTKLRKAQDRPAETVAAAPLAEPVAMTAVAEAPVVEVEEPKESSSRRLMRNMSKMLDNPAMNKMMVASQRGTLDVMYADFIAPLQLKGEEKEYFMELLLARQMNIVDLSMKMMGGNLSKEEQAALSAEMKGKNKLLKEEMEYFLNSADDVAEWKFYEKTMGDRMMLSQVEQTLGETDAALSDQTYRQLLEAIHAEKTSFDFSSNLGDDENMDMSADRFSEGNISSFAADLKSLNEKIAERARSILSPEQFLVFVENQTANTELQISQLEMAGQMFGSKK